MNNSSTIRVLLTVGLCAAILFAWEAFYGRSRREQQRRAAKSVATNAEKRNTQSDESVAQSASTQSSQKGTLGKTETSRQGAAVLVDWPSGPAKIVLTSWGGALQHASLKDPRFRELADDGTNKAIDLVQTAGSAGPWPLVASFPQSDFRVPENAKYEVYSRSTHTTKMRWRSSTVEITKSYTFDKKQPLIWLDVVLKNLTNRALNHRLEMKLFSHHGAQKSGGMTNPYPRIPTGLCFVNGALERRSVKGILGEDSGCSAAGCGTASGPVSRVGRVGWIGTDDRYFLTALVPRRHSGAALRCEIRLRNDVKQTAEVLLRHPQVKLAKKAIHTYRFTVFVGPKEVSKLDAVAGVTKEDPKLAESIEFGWFAVLCRPMVALLKAFHRWVGNWGIAIILLTIFVKAITLFWTTKSMRSMREMQRLKPKIDALREKFGSDRQRLNQEMMALYKAHKVNPVGGCLPMLIQMPVWFALYRTLGNAQELYRSGFVAWISDLTAPDPFFVLPIGMGLAMFAQQAITPQPMEGAQAKMMKYFMPGMFTVMMLWLPAGLTLYIFVNTVLTMAHQWYMNRRMPIVSVPNNAAKREKVNPEVTGASPPARSNGKAAAQATNRPTTGGPGSKKKSNRSKRRRSRSARARS